MRVKIEVEFEVTSQEEGFSEAEAKQAAELAAYNCLAFTENNIQVSKKPIKQFVDGFGECEVTIPSGDY